MALVRIIIICLLAQAAFGQFAPDAGLVSPHPYTPVVPTNQANSYRLNDNDLTTAWENAPILPEQVLSNPALNKAAFAKAELKRSMDGDLNTSERYDGPLTVRFEEPLAGGLLQFKLGFQEQLAVDLIYEDDIRNHFYDESNYALITLPIQKTNLKAVRFRSINFSSFEVFEFQAIELPVRQSIYLRFFEEKVVGQVFLKGLFNERTKNAVANIKIYGRNARLLSHSEMTSNSGNETFNYENLESKNLLDEEWKLLAEIPQTSVNTGYTTYFGPVLTEELKVEFTNPSIEWEKAVFYEIAVYDEYGAYGPPPENNPLETPTLGAFLGVNGQWGWGTNAYSDLAKAEEGIQLYAPTFTHARNYHDLSWDVKKAGEQPNFRDMATQGTSVHQWLDWDREYASWHDQGLLPWVSLQLYKLPQRDWSYQGAFQYGKQFAAHFGAQVGNGLVQTVEIGNEPWSFAANLYQEVARGMVDGIRSVDSTMRIFPCALQAADPSTENTPHLKNYAGVRLDAELCTQLDGFNVHAYSYRTTPNGKRVGTHPEDARSSFNEIFNALRWRDSNMPGKPIVLTEFGWDSPSTDTPCDFSECVPESAASAYGVRAALIAWRHGFDKAHWYFFADTPGGQGLYTKSGLTQPADKEWREKQVFRCFKQLLKLLGSYQFSAVLQEDAEVYAYRLQGPKKKDRAVITWTPTGFYEDHPPTHQTFNPEWVDNNRIKSVHILHGGPQKEYTSGPITIGRFPTVVFY